ncbi:bifunctional phosphopantothenoylcysteine decarboxylase/phosphopantothenate--cysteine ligase CoaBC [Leptolyngbya sp. FACHB-261]|nr:bifunctional phosphopantothenoylcysteine decarboxylase/phosphopantothenate--cysteine ligase CoaBC [Leptolyngbya sp. FACHB-261]
MPKRVLVALCGGIAAYKVCEVVSTLAKAGFEVRALLTKAAQQFVTPLTLATLSRHPAYTDQEFWSERQGRPLHIELGEWANLIVIAPLSANTLAKLSWGAADNLLTNTVLASSAPLLLAPAMNTTMWEQPQVQRNWALLQGDARIHSVGPGSGRLACDAVGAGRMAEPAAILAAVESLLWTGGRRDLAGRRVLISAGSTREHLDPVRFIGNPASGRMGFALAQAARARGAQVSIVHGPANPDLIEVAEQAGIECCAITSAIQMQAALKTRFIDADLTLMAAAVADVRPAHCATTKLPKQELPDSLGLEPVADIVADLGAHKRPDQLLVGFAAQTGEILEPARDKLQRKGLDAIVANAVDQPERGFGTSTNEAIFLNRQGQQQTTGLVSKLELAHQLFDFLLRS